MKENVKFVSKPRWLIDLLQRLKKNTNLPELVHSVICELNGQLTTGGQKHFITFIGDYPMYTYVYLVRAKDEAFDKLKKYKSVVENQKEKKD